jgi:hypothetical protein
MPIQPVAVSALLVVLFVPSPALPTAAPSSPGAPGAIDAGDVKVHRARFASAVRISGEPFRLNGAGLFRWNYFVKVYAAALYLPEGRAFDLASDVPRRLEIAYFVDIGAKGFGRAANQLLERSFAAEELAPLRERLDRLHAAYVDIRPGDRYTLTYLPGAGTELAHNGRRLVVIEGEDFARAYFSIWLGDRPIDGGLRDALLGT